MSETAKKLEIELLNIVKDFPGVRALDDVSFSVAAGEVHALVGKNGAGKSTLMHVLTGLYPPDSGEIRVRGKSHQRLTTAEAKAQGIAIVSQHAKYVGSLSIAENIFSGSLLLTRGGFIDWPRMYAQADERLRRFGLDIDVKRRMDGTSVAERQMIEIARALFAEASVVILDEPTAPLPKHDVAKLFGFVKRQKDRGASFIYISHYLEEIFEVADRVTVMRNGRIAGEAPVGSITQGELIRLISGANVERYRRPPTKPGPPVLELKGLTRLGHYAQVDITFHSGEVVGLTGLEGSGAGALVRGLFGLEALGSGEARIDGKPYAAENPTVALSRRLAYLPRDRHGLGIIGLRSVRDNITLSVLRELASRLGFIDGRKENALVKTYIETLGIKTPSPEAPVEHLSGGNQQKVVVAKLAATEPRMLFLDEPTQGVDVAAKAEILRIVDELSKRGVAVGVVSDELSELMDISDRILVFYRGRIVREFRKGREEITAVKLLAAIEGEFQETVQ
ncbi:sugar ABC transporter ATP-binding protein [Taklimakanibacter deserti]|uniref:sugar ABC transporter ATP-binding protein n=1 Tax=Taklimakanibacter deserti TaxID=2267839 RepID=UPI000E647511